jgi:hypothetical protein
LGQYWLYRKSGCGETTSVGDCIIKFSMSRHYLSNCFLLTIPILVWDFVFTDKLPTAFQPEIFWNNIPPIIAYGENISRIAMFIFMLLMPLKISTSTHKKGLALYVAGTLLYFVSWLLLIYFPNSTWSSNVLGFLAPAYTPLFWLTGIGLIGDTLFFNLHYKKWIFFFVVITFLLFHNWHTYLIYLSTHSDFEITTVTKDYLV